MFKIHKYILFYFIIFYIHSKKIEALMCRHCFMEACQKMDTSKNCYDKYCYQDSTDEDNVLGPFIVQRCKSKDDILNEELPFNDCSITQTEYEKNLPVCICDKDYCNTGKDFKPKPITGPALICLSCTSWDCKVGNTPPTHVTCEKGYDCYKMCLYDNSGAYKYIQRGCMHKGFSSNFHLKLNGCADYFAKESGRKQRVCICDQNNCNGGGDFY